VSAKPFMKAAGGKTKLLPEILKRLPAFKGLYHEPFVGGGAVFFELAERRRAAGGSTKGWVLNDLNKELLNAYVAVRDECEALVSKLGAIKHSEPTYYAARAKEETTSLLRATRFLYLNKTCFNGLYRVNSSGKFNVPIGDYKNPTIVEPENLRACARVLEGVALLDEDFDLRIAAAKSGDFVYADPPYLPRSKTADFTGYTALKFGLKDHERLAASLASASKRGAKFLCSQGDSPAIRSLFKEFTIDAVRVQHSVGAKKSSRMKVDEVLIGNSA